MALGPGTRIGGYEIVALVGTGGMGAVYRARDSVLRRDVAVKVLPPEFAAAPDRAQRFEREARLLATVSHANVAAIYGVETLPPARPGDPVGLALVLELVDGAGLDERIGSRPMPLREVTAIAVQIVDALDAAHERGIVHRDLKPANIRLTRDGVVKVLDFGLAKIAAASEPASLESTIATPTESGVVLGTAPYMSPEQARGQAVDKRTDIWAFGCVLYEMLTGRRAFAGATASDTIAAILEREPEWTALPPTTPPAMRRLLERCLTKDPKQRLRDIADARDALATPLTSAGAPVAAATSGRIAWLPWAIALAGLATGAWSLTRGWSPASPIPAEPALTRLTFDSGISGEPALSRDGQLLAYASTRLGRGDADVWLQQAGGGQPLRLTDDPADDGDPDLSPDGRQVVFRSERGGGGAYVVAALGGPARLLAAGARQPRFSPDGTRITYWTGQFRGGAGGPSAAFVLPVGGGTAVRLLGDLLVAQQPQWAPDGTSILLLGGRRASADASNQVDAWLVPLDGSAPIRTAVLDRPGWRQAVTFERGQVGRWTDAGLLVAIDGTLWSVPLDARDGRVGEPQRLLFGAASVRGPTGAAGRRVVFEQAIGERAIDRLALSANEPPVRLYADGNRLTRRATASTDGQRLVFERDGAGETEIWVKELRSGEQTMVLNVQPGGNLSATISPDGRRITFNRDRGPDVTGVIGSGHVVDVAGGVPRQVCDNCQLWGFLPDNRGILATLNDRAIAVLDDRTGDAANWLVVTGDKIDRPSVSPDGRWLAFRRGSTESRVFLTRAGPGNVAAAAAIDEPTTTGRPAGWSPDSRTLYLLLDADGFRCLWAQHVDPGTGRPVGAPTIARHLHSVVGVSTSYGNAIGASGFLYEAISLRSSLWRLDWPQQ